MRLHGKTTQIINFILWIVSERISCSVRNVGLTKSAPSKRAFDLSLLLFQDGVFQNEKPTLGTIHHHLEEIITILRPLPPYLLATLRTIGRAS